MAHLNEKKVNSDAGTIVDSKPGKVFTWRILLVFIIVMFVFAMVEFVQFYLRYLYNYSGFYTGHSLPNAACMGILILLVFLINPILRMLKVKRLFSKGEMVLLYAMLVVAGNIFQSPLFFYSLVSLQKLALTSPGVYGSALDQFSTLIIPKGEEALRVFWKGSASVPWGEWFWPIIFWSLLLLGIIFQGICIGTIIRRRWTDQEHLRYPLTIPVMEVLKPAEKGNIINGIWRNPFAWSGFAVAFFATLMHFLKTKYSWLPWFSTNYTTTLLLRKYVAATPFFNDILGGDWAVIRLSPSSFTIGYLLPLDFLFSVGFFLITNRVLMGVCKASGFWAGQWTMDKKYGAATAFGGFIIIGILYIWMMRRDIVIMFKSAFFNLKTKIDDSSEGLSYKTAFIGLVVSFIFLVSFAVILLGTSVQWAILYFGILVLLAVATARTSAESGNTANRVGGGVNFEGYVLIPMLGQNLIGMNSIAGTGYLWNITMLPIQGACYMALHSWKLADDANCHRRSISKGMLLSGALSLIVFFAGSLIVCYKWSGRYGYASYGEYGFINLLPAAVLGRLQPDSTLRNFFLGGAATTAVLFYLKAIFAWWPLHPIGFIFAYSPYIRGTVYSFVWLVKFIIMRYGGMTLYRKFMPFFVALMIGEGVAEITIAIINAFIILR